MRIPKLILASLIVTVVASAPASARYKYCAFRTGPNGPCTCKSDSDTAGQWTTVSRSLCKRADKKPAAGTATVKPAEKPAAPIEAPPAAAAAPVAPADPAPAAASPPPAAAEAPAAAPAPSPTSAITTAALPSAPTNRLTEIRARGKLICGVSTGLAGFSKLSDAGDWTGIDADYCRAVAAAVLSDGGKVEFVPLEANARFEALQTGKIDLLSRNTTWNMNRDVDLGLDFAGVLYLDGQSFMANEERGLVSAQQLAGSKICVETGTTAEANVAYYLKAQTIEAEIVKHASRDELVKAYLAGSCDAYAGDRSSLYADRAGFPDPLKHAVLPEVISKEPLGPAIRDDDRTWTEVNRWVLAALINAEEAGLDKATAGDTAKSLTGDAERLVTAAGASGAKLGLNASWLRDVVAATGNYGEIFEANLGKSSALGMDRGLNALWNKGGLLYAPPMW